MEKEDCWWGYWRICTRSFLISFSGVSSVSYTILFFVIGRFGHLEIIYMYFPDFTPSLEWHYREAESIQQEDLMGRTAGCRHDISLEVCDFSSRPYGRANAKIKIKS